jgi:hypothetical protein
MCAFFIKWKDSKQPGLSSETFHAYTNMCTVVPQIVKYLLSTTLFAYVLTRHLNSDALEHRFGRYRQMAGGNYHIGYKQILLSEKKIKIISTLMQSSYNVESLRLIKETKKEIDLNAEMVLPTVQIDTSSLYNGEYNILFYVSGYIARHIENTRRCEHCIKIILDQDVMPEFEADEQHRFLFDSINRGGLRCPSDLLFYTVIFGYCIFKSITQDSENLQLLSSSNNILGEYIHCSTSSAAEFSFQLIQDCVVSHPLVVDVLRCLFKIMLKNFLKRLSSNRSAPQLNKIKKLRSSL